MTSKATDARTGDKACAAADDDDKAVTHTLIVTPKRSVLTVERAVAAGVLLPWPAAAAWFESTPVVRGSSHRTLFVTRSKDS
ncbi:MAG: hypothetical protein CMI16_07040 [Opitutaceae bacterium]|nr:hypothetical protein [Opitutaceae bacterium]